MDCENCKNYKPISVVDEIFEELKEANTFSDWIKGKDVIYLEKRTANTDLFYAFADFVKSAQRKYPNLYISTGYHGHIAIDGFDCYE